MSRIKSRYYGKIGFCNNVTLGINKPGGHYVYIRRIDKSGKTCDVNVITSLEDKNQKFTRKKLANVRAGFVYPIPFFDGNFKRWSGVTNNPKQGIPVSNIKGIGNRYIKKRHRFFIGKFLG